MLLGGEAGGRRVSCALHVTDQCVDARPRLSHLRMRSGSLERANSVEGIPSPGESTHGNKHRSLSQSGALPALPAAGRTCFCEISIRVRLPAGIERLRRLLSLWLGTAQKRVALLVLCVCASESEREYVRVRHRAEAAEAGTHAGLEFAPCLEPSGG